ncbi:MAG: helix-turn-helix domain-containing protein [Ktedonobacterales bacterium]
MVPFVPGNVAQIREGTGPPLPLLLTIGEAARLLSLSRAQTYRLIQRGELSTVHIGRAARVTRDALVAYVAQLDSRSAS